MRYKLGEKKPKKRQGNIPTLLRKMERDLWYTVEQLEQMVAELELSSSTVGNLLNYGVQQHYVVSEEITRETNSSPQGISDISIDNKFSVAQKPSTEEIARRIEACWQNLEEIKQEKLKYEKDIANLEEELAEKQRKLQYLTQKEERLQEILSPFRDNSADFSEAA